MPAWDLKSNTIDFCRPIFHPILAHSPLVKQRQFTVVGTRPLLAYLLDELGLKRTGVKNLLKFGAVSVNGNVVRQFDYPLANGDIVTVGDPQTAAAIGRLHYAGIQSVYEDDALIVVDKPSGLLTVATDREKLDTSVYAIERISERP